MELSSNKNKRKGLAISKGLTKHNLSQGKRFTPKKDTKKSK